MPRIVTLQFNAVGKTYEFDAGHLQLTPHDRVLVETERGVELASVVHAPTERDEEDASPALTQVIRAATQEDFETLKRNADKEKQAFDFCNKRITERSMQMKLIRVEYLFDSSKAIFYFTADGRVDFRILVKDLAHMFHTRIEMRQIGVRDESKMIGGIGICGRELCCCSWLRDFQPVSVKMAKEQNLALNPGKISGQCGRLLCCLDYEYKTYCGLRKNFPKCGKHITTASGSGVVEKLNLLTGAITLKLDDGKLITITREELTGEAASRIKNPQELPDVPKPAKDSETGIHRNDEKSRSCDDVQTPPRKKHRSRNSGQGKTANTLPPGENQDTTK